MHERSVAHRDIKP